MIGYHPPTQALPWRRRIRASIGRPRSDFARGFRLRDGFNGYRYVKASPHFRVQHADVSGQANVSVDEVLEIAGLQDGPSLLAVDSDAIHESLMQHPWVKGAKVPSVSAGSSTACETRATRRASASSRGG